MEATVNVEVLNSLGRSANRVAVALLAHQTAAGVAAVTRTTISAETGISRQTIWRSITELKERGLVTEILPSRFLISEELGRRVG